MRKLTEDGQLRSYEVTITEMLQRVVTVEAMDHLGAEQIVSERWRNSEYVLDSNNFTGVEFDVEIAEERND